MNMSATIQTPDLSCSIICLALLLRGHHFWRILETIILLHSDIHIFVRLFPVEAA